MSLSKLSLPQVTSNVASGMFKIRSISASKSDVWKQFGIVTNDGEDLDYVACKLCHTAITYMGRQTGTSTMKRHKCRVVSNQASIVSHCVSGVSSISKSDKDTVTRACADFVCKDLRPFSTVSGDGFIQLVQSVIDVQRKHNTRLNAKDLLPHPTTVSRNVEKRAAAVLTELADLLQDAFLNGGQVSFTGDIWTDSHRQRSFLTLTTHWIADNWDLVSRVVCTEQFDPTLKKTGINIKAAVLSVFHSVGITHAQIDRSVFTTDRGSNMIVALEENTRIDCIAHVLNTVLRHTFDEKKTCPEAVTGLLNAAKSLVRYIKKGAIQNLLPKGVIQSCDTRWNTRFLMLESVQSQYQDIQRTLLQHAPTELRKLTAIDTELLDELLPFLRVCNIVISLSIISVLSVMSCQA